MALCGTIGFPGGCHGWFADHPGEFKDFMLTRLGQERFDALVIRAHTPAKIDEKVIEIWLKEELNKYGDKSS